ncbi:MAG: energy transducer TonB [Verrucomicrobiae bacterium]|nr:energy transducer TonB [Verrucomicrobiae bacterium]MCP5542250.1 energy transducer TonB [Akkermansiaceae bacterium]
MSKPKTPIFDLDPPVPARLARVIAPTVALAAPERSIAGSAAVSCLLHGAAIVCAAGWWIARPGDFGDGEAPVIAVVSLDAAEIETDADGPDNAVVKTPPPIREALPETPETPPEVQPEFYETMDPAFEWAEAVAPRPVEPVVEFLVAELEASMVFPEPVKETAPPLAKRETPTVRDTTPSKPKKAAPQSGRGASKTVPPRPVSPVGPVYPATAKRAGRQGTAWVRVSVKASGALRSVRIDRGTGSPALDAAAVSCVRRWRFSPALKAGVPVDAEALVKVSFRLK